MESKRNETFVMIFLGPKANQETWSWSQRRHEASTRQEGAPHPRGPLVAPPAYFFCLYILLYPKNIRGSHKTTFPPPQPFVPVRSHLGPFPAICRRGNRSRRASTSTPLPLRWSVSILPQTFGSIVICLMASSLSLILNTKFYMILVEIYSM